MRHSGIEVPEPVYFCSVEPPSSSAIHEFEVALKEICVEDPSIRVRQDKDSGQTIIETMGELHLEIIKDKFTREYGLNVFIGPLQVIYFYFSTNVDRLHIAKLSPKQSSKLPPSLMSKVIRAEPTRQRSLFFWNRRSAALSKRFVLFRIF